MTPGTLRHHLWRWTLRAITPALIPFERRLSSRLSASGAEREAAQPGPIFIVGAPRCGSTLLYKVMVDSLDLAYFNAFTARFFATPLVGFRLSQIFGLTARSGFESRYGNMEGLGSPHEAGQFWYRWFPRPPDVYAPSGSLTVEARRQIRSTVAAIAALHQRPVLFKNLFNSLRIGALTDCFADASFLFCRRDPVDNALSLLRGRLDHGGDKSAWWSLPPRELSALRQRPYVEQVAGQVYCIERQIAADQASFGSERFLTVRYEDLCSGTHAQVARLADFLQSRGHSVAADLSRIPKAFEARRASGLDPSDERAVAEAVRDFYETEADV